ncbi:MAG: FAD:protein FMN transferase [Vicinamibacterales bacterium]
MRVRGGLGPWALVALAAGSGGCQRPAAPAPARVEARRLAMGSELHLTAITADAAAARRAFAQVDAEFERLEGLLSVWREGSDVSRLNAAAGGDPVPVHADTRAVLRASAQVSDWTGGAFDATFGALAEIWKFDHDQDGRVPTAAEIAARRPRVDYRAVVVDERRGTAAITRPGVRVHVGGIGKGYAVDRAVAVLRAAGLRDFMVQAGGDLYVGGTAGDGPWRLGIQDPRGPSGEPFAVVELSDATLSTSGDYERFFERDGVRYHHILDPSTGQPARGTRSVTIVTRQALWADGLSTGVFVLGPARGLALVERLPDVEAVIVTEDNAVLVSSGLRDRVIVRRPPTP